MCAWGKNVCGNVGLTSGLLKGASKLYILLVSGREADLRKVARKQGRK